MKNKKSRLELQAIKILKNRGITITALIIVIVIIISIIISISGKTQATNGEEPDAISENVKMVKSVEGKWVPVPKGYSASKIPGEMNVNGGFVIYEGENIDWSYWENSQNTSAIDDNSIKKVKKEISNSTNSITTTNQTNTSNIVNNTNTVENTINSENLENTTNVQNIVNENVVENTILNEIVQNSVIDNSSVVNNDTFIVETNDNPIVLNSENNNVVKNEITNSVEENTIIDEKNVENMVSENTISNTLVENSVSNETVNNVVENNVTNNVVSENKVNASNNTLEKENANQINEIEMAEYDDSWMLEQDANTFKLQTERNQFVWVPVENVSELFGVDEKGKLWGKMYSFKITGKKPYNWTEENGIIKIINPNGVREPSMNNTNGGGRENMMLPQNIRVKRYEYLSKELEQSFYKTIKSIEKYGGFYIGRYETTCFDEIVPSVKRMKEDTSRHNIFLSYLKCKMIGESNDAVTTMPIWGCLRDATLSWFVSSNAIRTSDGSLITNRLLDETSIMWGNSVNSEFKYYSDTNMTISEKKDGEQKYIPTGSTEYSKINNTYDMGGNSGEIDMTMIDEGYHVMSGAGFWFNGGCSLTSKYGMGIDMRWR